MSSHIRAVPARWAGGGALAVAEAAAVGVEGGRLADVAEDALDLVEVGPAAAVEADAARAADEEGGLEMVFEHADAVGDGGGGDAEFGAGLGEALMAGGGLEEAQAVEGGQRFHGFVGGGRSGITRRNIICVYHKLYFSVSHRSGSRRRSSARQREEGVIPKLY